MTDTILDQGRPASMEGRTAPETSVYNFLDSLGVTYRTLSHTPAFTMEECEAVRRQIGAPVFKNLFLTNKQHSLFFLLMMPADKPFKTKYLSSQLGCARLSFASPQEMEQLLRIHPGAVSPMGLIHEKEGKVRLIADEELKGVDTYACHPCVNTASVALSLDDLIHRVVPASGHEVTWVTLPREHED